LLNKLGDWLNDRTGYRTLVHHALDEPIPGGARMRYVFGSALSTTFMMQLATGLLLMCSYSPSATTAWGSVFYINEEMTLGWIIRGLHHFGSSAMIVLLGLHLIQVLWAGAYRSPREVNWWFGMALLFLTLGFSLTGYLLPWDQKGYWATKVATNIASGAPLVGPYLTKAIVGGLDYGNQTLTRFYALHVGLLPLLFFAALFGHVALFRKHGLTPPKHADRHPTGKFWPEQLFMDSVASLGVFAVVAVLVLKEGGANLDAPADPASANYPARPEWYFLSLFQLLKYFEGDRVIIGTFIIPTAIMAVMLLIPLLDKALPRKFAHFLGCCFVFALVGGAGFLTYQALADDGRDVLFQAERTRADAARQRAIALAKDPSVGIPPDGAMYILLRDPLTHGANVFEAKCQSCHYFQGKGQTVAGAAGAESMSPQTASDLAGFGTRGWIRGLLENPGSDTYFGKVKPCGGMKRWRKNTKLTAKELDDIADFFANLVSTTPDDMGPGEWENQPSVKNHPGYKAFSKDGECVTCHADWSAPNDEAPNLFAWGSPRWVARMVHRPGSPYNYGFLDAKDQMPAFPADRMTANDMTTLTQFLTQRSGREKAASAPQPAPAPKGGEPESGANESGKK
jgi:ubiquinol-cytochrome c reductase cytochrome b subunit